jgi:hypothetical protein
MRRWIMFGVVVMLAFIVIANLSGPRAWASDAQSPFLTVPTRTPKPSGTLTLVPPTAPPTKPPVNNPTNTPAPEATDTPDIVPTTTTTVVAETVTPPSAVTVTATPGVVGTATATVDAVEITPTATAAIDQPTATATNALPAETTPTATPEPGAVTSVAPTLTLSGNVNVVPVQIPAAAEQADSATSNNALPSWCLLIIASVLFVVGAILLFGRRTAKAK